MVMKMVTALGKIMSEHTDNFDKEIEIQFTLQ